MHSININRIYLALTVIFAIPFLLSGNDYQDDIYRSASGNLSFWFENARPLSVYILQLLNQSVLGPDMFPLTIILSILILGFTSKKIVDELHIDNSYIKIALFCIMLSNPFFLQNLSYKYDSITMALCLLLSYLYIFKLDDFKLHIKHTNEIILILMILCLYQPTLSYLFGLLILKSYILYDKTNIKKALIFLIQKSLVIVITFLVYKFTISDLLLNDDYKKAGALISLSNNPIRTLTDNTYGYLAIAKLYLEKPLLLLFLALTCLSFIFKFAKCKLSKIIITILCIVVLIFALTSTNILLSKPMFHPREMIGFSTFFVFIAYTSINGPISKKIVTGFGFVMFITTFSTSCYLLNFKKSVAFRDSLIISDIITSINRYGNDNIKRIAFTNDVLDILPTQQTMVSTNPLLKKLIGNVNLNYIWYAKAIVNRKYAIHKEVQTGALPPLDANWTANCYTKTTIKSHILYVNIGTYCR